jgi:hypothetical protein
LVSVLAGKIAVLTMDNGSAAAEIVDNEERPQSD